jgi:hypothetical protein
VARLTCSFRDAWPFPRVVSVCLSLPEFSFVLPRVSLSLGPHASQRVLECLGLSFACGTAEVDGDVVAARLVRFAFKAPAGARRLHGRQLSSPYDVEIRFPACAGGLAQAVCLGPRTSQRRRLVVRSGDLSEIAAVQQRTGCLASESLDEDLHAFPETQC